MKKFRKVLSLVLAVCMVCAVSVTAWAEDYEVTTYTDGDKVVTEGSVTVEPAPAGSRSHTVEYVGDTPDDYGPWEYGVWFDDQFGEGYVFSYYTNPVYWHGSSARGSTSLVRSDPVAPDDTSSAEATTYAINGNKSYWRVEKNMG